MLAAILLLTVAGCGKSNVVATVNGENITQQQLDEMVEEMKKYYKAQGLDLDANKDSEMLATINSMTMDQLITQTVLLQEAKKMDVKLESGAIDKEIAQYKEQMTEEKFNQFLKDNKISDSRLRSMIEKDLLISGLQDKLLEDVKPATEAQAREYFDKNKGEFVTPASYQVRHILAVFPESQSDKNKADLEARTKILAILEQLKQGKDFAELAKEKSEDPGTAANGGQYVFSPGDPVPEFEQAAKALKPGEYTKEPVKTTYGYHIIKMEKITPEKPKTFEEVKDSLINTLTDQARQEKVNAFVAEAKKKAEIVNKLDKPAEQKPEGEESKDGKKE
jgi:peptidyl-prolyl cis-trans isomerase C